MIIRYVNHPGLRLACWLLVVLALQVLAPPYLPVAAILYMVSAPASLRRWWRLAWRTRWLLLSLVIVLALSVAGEPVFSALPSGPTWEGANAALVQALRLLLVLAAVAVLLESTPLPALMAGCHGLLRPFDRLGLNSDRIVARLALTLHYAETLPRPRDWRALILPFAGASAPASEQRVFLPQSPVQMLDIAGLCIAVLLLAVALLTVAGG